MKFIGALKRLVGMKPPQMAYDAARVRRRLAGWNPSRESAKSIMAMDGEMMRARARDVVRNNPYAASAADSFVANLIGAGIKPSPLIDEATTRDALNKSWLEWTDECDADGVADFYGMQAIVARALFDSGEIFVRRRPRSVDDGFSVPLQIQLLESDMLDFGHNTTHANGNSIVSGVEFDLIGRRVAYHFWENHPGDMLVSGGWKGGRVRVPASEVLHIFKPTRAGQVRGAPLVAPAIVKLWVLDQYDDAELDRKKIAAMYAGFITSPAPTDLMDDDESAGEGIATLEPGTMQTLLPGEDIKFSSPAEVGGSYEAFQYRTLLAVFSAMGVPYTLGTGDLKRANYSSLRGAIVEYRRRLEQLQHGVIVFQFCRPIRMWWLNEVALSGAVALPGYVRDRRAYNGVKWIPPKFEWVDPYKDRQAEKIAVQCGFKSRSDVIEAEGYDPEEVDRRIAADRQREADLGLNFDSTIPVDPSLITDPADAAAAIEDAADAQAA